MTMMRASSQSQKIEGLTKEFPEAVVQLDRELEAAPQNAGLWFQRDLLRLLRFALVHQGQIAPVGQWDAVGRPLAGHKGAFPCTHAFGMANHFYTTGNKKRYAELIDYILELGQEAAWNCFAFRHPAGYHSNSTSHTAHQWTDPAFLPLPRMGRPPWE